MGPLPAVAEERPTLPPGPTRPAGAGPQTRAGTPAGLGGWLAWLGRLSGLGWFGFGWVGWAWFGLSWFHPGLRLASERWDQ